MMYQNFPRKARVIFEYKTDKGFYIDGKNFEDCLTQLREWGNEHKEKWIYIYDCGFGPAKPIPVGRHIIEVNFFDTEPAANMLMWRLFQEGSENKHEIDTLSEEEKEKRLRLGVYSALRYDMIL